MIVVGLVLAGVAAAIHGYVFVMESLTWTSPRTRATFGTSPDEAAATKELAFNQGFYNLFLAVLVVLGSVLYAADQRDVGLTLVVAGAGSMAAAGVVLLVSSPSKARAALVQLVPPALGVLAVVVGLTA
ncbi:putative membrane protein [Cellulosimicrobium cellulans J34]|nr:putative membrane protein [Cellulosimicrobium cellulans J34]SME89986.1 putative membrane protein [Cellulosimicrobium cellulans J1]